jgi:hypothetical protein
MSSEDIHTLVQVRRPTQTHHVFAPLQLWPCPMVAVIGRSLMYFPTLYTCCSSSSSLAFLSPLRLVCRLFCIITVTIKQHSYKFDSFRRVQSHLDGSIVPSIDLHCTYSTSFQLLSRFISFSQLSRLRFVSSSVSFFYNHRTSSSFLMQPNPNKLYVFLLLIRSIASVSSLS